MKSDKMRNNYQAFIVLFLIVSIIIFSAQASFSQEDKQPKLVTRKITGEVGFVNDGFISVVYRKEKDKGKEYEMMFYVDQGVILDNLTDNDLKKLSREDIVRVEYIEIQQQDESKRIAQKIKFIKKKPAAVVDLKGFKQ